MLTKDQIKLLESVRKVTIKLVKEANRLKEKEKSNIKELITAFDAMMEQVKRDFEDEDQTAQ